LKPQKESFLKSGYAHVSFKSDLELEKFKKANLEDFEKKNENNQDYGLKYLIEEYNNQINVDTEQLQKEIDESIFKFDVRESEHRKRIDELSSMPDKDGWITVTNKGRKKTSGTGGAKFAPINLSPDELIALKDKEKEKYKDNFYRFQKAEKQQKALTTLRKKFEADKMRMNKLKEGRKFKPF